MQDIILDIQHIRQTYTNSCGAAALEMMYKYWKLEDENQEDIFNRLPKFDAGNGYFVIKEEIIVGDAIRNGFISGILQVNFSDLNDCVEFVSSFISLGIPFIVCQQWKINSGASHFRVVSGVDKDFIYFKDSNVERETIKWRHQKFFDHWQSDGNMVLGNTLIFISRQKSDLPQMVQDTLG